MVKDKFKSKSGFILASIGAAVGLGNALRFPGLCAKYGGGAFLLIYFAALIILGLPLLNAEIALGRKYKSGAPVCMSNTVKKFRALGGAVGWASGLNSVFTAIIYAGLAGWIIAAAGSFAPLAINAPQMTQPEISAYFFSKVLHARIDGIIDGISPVVLACIAAAWVIMYFCLKGGAGSLAKAARFTVIIPMALLALIAGRGLLYENSSEALAALFIPDFSCLSRPDLWLTALGQVFFSLSIVVGIMPVYGSYLPAGANIFGCSLAVAAADFGVSALASVVLFTTLYGTGLQGAIGSSGIITAFAVYPAALTALFGGNVALNAVAGVIFYLSLAMMAVQSAVSMLEAFVSPFSEARGKNKKPLVTKLCLVGGAVSVVFATTAAPLIVEISDNFVNFYNVLALGIAESLILAFSDKTPELIREINAYSKKIKLPAKLFNFSAGFLCPAVLVSLSALEISRLVNSPPDYPIYLVFTFGICVSALIIILAAVLSRLFSTTTPFLDEKAVLPSKYMQN